MDVIIEDFGSTPDSAVIWLHGLGADGSDFVPAIPYLNLQPHHQVRFVFPSAPLRAVTINNGLEMPSWYDIKQMLPQRQVCHEQLQASVAAVNELIQQLIDQGIAAQRIVLVGFSQGGALAYQCVLAQPSPLGAVAAMSTYLPDPQAISAASCERAIDVLILHGEQDDVVPVEMGRAAQERLHDLGYTPQWYDFKMEHQVTQQSLAVLGRWISNYLGNK